MVDEVSFENQAKSLEIYNESVKVTFSRKASHLLKQLHRKYIKLESKSVPELRKHSFDVSLVFRVPPKLNVEVCLAEAPAKRNVYFLLHFAFAPEPQH